MKKGRMNKKQKEMKKELSTLIFLMFQEGGLYDNEITFPDHLKSNEYIYKNDESQNEMVEFKIRNIKNIAGSFINQLKNQNPEDLQRVYNSMNLIFE